MFKGLHNLLHQQEEPQSNLSEMQSRMMEVVQQYSSEIPLAVRPMLSGILHGLGDKMTDDKIMYFVAQTRQLLDYIENGDLPFTDVVDSDH